MADTHDALGRVIETQHASSENTTYVVGTNLVASHSHPIRATTTYTYVPKGQADAGQMESTKAPDSGVIINQYDLLGSAIRTSGARGYPVGYTYNLYGQIETMTIWKDYAGLASGRRSPSWGYQAITGLLASTTDTAWFVNAEAAPPRIMLDTRHLDEPVAIPQYRGKNFFGRLVPVRKNSLKCGSGSSWSGG